MARLLVSEIIEEVQTQLSQVVGTSTNLYGTPRTLQHIQDAYLELIDEFGDRNLIEYNNKTLNGTTGVITTDLVSALDNHEINRFEDILAVWLTDHNSPLPIVPPRINIRTIEDGDARYLDANITALRPFKCYPITATNTIVVMSRAHPELPLAEDSYVYIDRLLLVYRAAYLYAEDDATAPGQITKFEKATERRIRQLKASNNNQAILLDGRRGSIPTAWDTR